VIVHVGLVVHAEWHRGYGLLPILYVRRAPRPGDRVVDGGQAGTLELCPACSGLGLLHVADHHPEPTRPTEAP
jgi:hypothetical protein